MSNSIDVSSKKYICITEQLVEQIAFLKQDILAIAPYIESSMDNNIPLTQQHLSDIMHHADDMFSSINQLLVDTKVSREQLEKMKDRSNPHYSLLKYISLTIPARHIILFEEKWNSKIDLTIAFDYGTLFTVKLIVRVKGTICKTKDIKIFANNEVRTTPYANELTLPKGSMSSMILFRQMTFAANRFIIALPSLRNSNAIDVIRWLKNYDNLYSAKCILCHSQMPTTGADALCVPSLRHFDTGSPYHPSCCSGENLLRT